MRSFIVACTFLMTALAPLQNANASSLRSTAERVGRAIAGCSRSCAYGNYHDIFDKSIKCLVAETYHPYCVQSIKDRMGTQKEVRGTDHFHEQYNLLSVDAKNMIRNYIAFRQGKLKLPLKAAQLLRQALENMGYKSSKKGFVPEVLVGRIGRDIGIQSASHQELLQVQHVGKILIATEKSGAIGQIVLSSSDAGANVFQSLFYIPPKETRIYGVQKDRFVLISGIEKLTLLAKSDREKIQKKLQKVFGVGFATVPLIPKIFMRIKKSRIKAIQPWVDLVNKKGQLVSERVQKSPERTGKRAPETFEF